MNLQKLDLREHLVKMGMSNLLEIIGEKRVKIISKITEKSITEGLIADLLIQSLEQEIFLDSFFVHLIMG